LAVEAGMKKTNDHAERKKSRTLKKYIKKSYRDKERGMSYVRNVRILLHKYPTNTLLPISSPNRPFISLFMTL